MVKIRYVSSIRYADRVRHIYEIAGNPSEDVAGVTLPDGLRLKSARRKDGHVTLHFEKRSRTDAPDR